jgi:methyl-accepting chemotaxis protein
MGRKIYFIKKDFQTRFIVRFVVTTTIWAAAAVSLFALLGNRRLEEVLYSPHINIRTTMELLMPSALQAHVISLALFAAILVYAIYALWKRLSVPLYCLKKDLARVSAGDLGSGITLREGEEFRDLASDLDGMRSGLRQKFVRVKDAHETLSAAASDLERAVLKGRPSAQHVASLRSAVERVKEELNGFTW